MQRTHPTHEANFILLKDKYLESGKWISVDFVILIERGINAPSFETIEHMAKKLRVPVMELFDFRGRDRSGIEQRR